MKIGFIGAGKMAGAIIKGLKLAGFELFVSQRDFETSQAVAQKLGVQASKSHQDLIDQVDLVILGVKPQFLSSALAGLTFHKPVMSMAAGVTLDRLAGLTATNIPLIRIMPNLNALILKSTTAICFNDLVTEDLKVAATTITDSFGSTFVVSEQDFDNFTALAGSSPAYIALFIEALAKAGVKNGMPKETALAIVSQTVQATAQNLLAGEDSPHNFIDKVCSPGGTTIAGIMELEKEGLTHAVCSAIDKTIEKAKSL